MLEAYFDDSASDSRPDKRIVLAGYMQSAEAWGALAQDWKDELARSPALTSLHMTTCFQGWSEQAREAKLDKFVAILEKYKPLSIECSISRAAYTDTMRNRAPYDLRHVYFSCFVGVMYGVARTVAEEGLSGPVELIFDEQGDAGTGAALWYLPLKHKDPLLRYVLGGPPRFASDDEVVPLQAADMLAWYVRRCAEKNCSPRQQEIADAIRFRHRFMEIPDALIEAWGKSFEQMPGIKEVQGRRGSTNRFMRQFVKSVPPDRLVSSLDAIARRASWLRQLRTILTRVGLRWVWKRIAKRKLPIR